MSKKRPNPNDGSSSSKRRHLSEVTQNSIHGSQNDDALRSGKILKIHLTNFMCHSNLMVEFGNRVNMLIGANGSGKSAILTALVIGLGARARETNRSTSIKQLVKNGENSADIEISIANYGTDAYEIETYGRVITVCRHILASGSSSYKIKDERGTIVSKRIDDLHKILLYHNIQTDNPVFVLNQDSARTFLKEMDPSKNYTLFLKATQIETILEKLNQCGVMYQDYKYRLRCYRKQVEFMEKELDELKEKYDRLQSADIIKNNIKQYKLEALWCKAIEQEKVVSDIEESIKKLEVKNGNLKKLIDGKDSDEQIYETQISSFETEFKKRNDELRIEHNKLIKLKVAWKEAAEKYESKNYELKKLEKKMEEYKKQIECYEERIEERSGSGLTQIENMRRQNEQRLEQLEHDQQEINTLIVQQKRELVMMDETKNKQEEEFENMKSRRNKIADQIVSMEREISKISTSSRNQLAVYGPNMSAFIEEVKKQQSKFSKLPLGPLGQYIHVKTQKWRGTVELLLGNLLTCFIVDNDKDSKLLTAIKNKFNIRNSIIMTKFHQQVYDVSSGKVEPPHGSTLLMDEIRCNNPVVLNCLIDRGQIETILLTEDQNLAVNLTSYQENVPHNLKRIILLKPFIEYYPAPLYRAYSLQAKAPRYIQVNMVEMKKNMEGEVFRLQESKSMLENKLREFKTKMVEIYRHIKQNSDLLMKHQNNKVANADQIEEIKSVEYPEEAQIEFFKKEISEIQNSLSSVKQRFDDTEQEVKDLLQDQITKNKEFDEHKRKLDSSESDINEFRKSADDIKSKLHSLQNDAHSWSQRIQGIQERITEKKDELTEQYDKLSTLKDSALAVGDRIEVTKTEEQLLKLIKKSEYSIKQISSTTESIDDIKGLLEDKQQKYEKSQVFTVSLSQTLDALKKSRVQRFKFIMNLKNHMALRVKFTFDSVLKIKNFNGDITFNHKDAKLTLNIIPRDKHIDNAVSNTKSLSGGERSFSTVALLLSLWSCVDHPFYFLDEYDVFTDQVNREIMTKLLLGEADKKPHRQYTFLTPQDVSFVEATDTVKIHRLAEPKR